MDLIRKTGEWSVRWKLDYPSHQGEIVFQGSRSNQSYQTLQPGQVSCELTVVTGFSNEEIVSDLDECFSDLVDKSLSETDSKDSWRKLIEEHEYRPSFEEL